MACKSQLEKTEKSYSVSRSELMACESQVEKTEKSYSVTSTDANEAEGVTRTHRKYVKEQRKRTNENIRRCKDEKSQIEVDLAEIRKQKHATNTKIAELTIEIDKLKEEKKKLQQEKEILFQTMDNINKKISAEESARECLDRLDAVIGLNTTLLNKINMLEEQRHSIIGIKGAPLRYQPKRKVPEPLQLNDKL
ncbi:paramyosin-like isoform X2 [Mercenaria mercenaria]|uniref:paramyosin-like isoform X2 n=1 Tax=Mercenaria mercenaria TaxID=6596 RepID=UPI00234EA087|nr:paramyosin-like isoform X2 [Mercenaria mercenaria]